MFTIASPGTPARARNRHLQAMFAAAGFVAKLLTGAPASAQTLEELRSIPCAKPPFGWDLRGRPIPDALRTYPIERKVGEHTFVIPRSYFWIWPAPSQINCPQVGDRFGIRFWMPDLKAPEESWIHNQTDDRPPEIARPHPGRSEWIVLARTIEAVTPETIGVPRQISNILDLYKSSEVPRPGKMIRVRDFTMRQGPVDSIIISCRQEIKRCTADIEFHDLKLLAFLHFSYDALDNSDAVIAGFRTLLTRWKQGT